MKREVRKGGCNVSVASPSWVGLVGRQKRLPIIGGGARIFARSWRAGVTVSKFKPPLGMELCFVIHTVHCISKQSMRLHIIVNMDDFNKI